MPRAFSLSANSRAKAMGHTDGFAKILACAETDRVLGVHIIGHEAGTVIHECGGDGLWCECRRYRPHLSWSSDIE